MKVELDHEKLNLAAERAEALASRVRTNAASARRATPIVLPSLEGIETKADHLEEQAIFLRLLAGVALLLDESGQVDLPVEQVGNALEEILGSFLTAKFNDNYGFGDNTDFPWIEVALGLDAMRGMTQGVAPVFQTTRTGQMLLKRMLAQGGRSAQWAEWLLAGGGKRQGMPAGLPKSWQKALPNRLWSAPGWAGRGAMFPTGGWADPLAKGAKGGLAVMRGLGVLGGGLATVNGGINLYQQGRPDEAFKREGAGYVADVAETAFAASSTAFLIAPNPVTATAAVGSGLVWAGAEVVDNWDDISETASKAWDKVTPW